MAALVHVRELCEYEKIREQAGAEPCQAQHSLSLELDTSLLGLITQPAVAGAGA